LLQRARETQHIPEETRTPHKQGSKKALLGGCLVFYFHLEELLSFRENDLKGISQLFLFPIFVFPVTVWKTRHRVSPTNPSATDPRALPQATLFPALDLRGRCSLSPSCTLQVPVWTPIITSLSSVSRLFFWVGMGLRFELKASHLQRKHSVS
jgi:hypothetical protein